MKNGVVGFLLGLFVGYRPFRGLVHLLYLAALVIAYMAGAKYGRLEPM